MYKNIIYSQAINQATHQAMKLQKNVMIMGQLIDYKPGIFGTTVGLLEKFGKDRVRDFPVVESLMTSAYWYILKLILWCMQWMQL